MGDLTRISDWGSSNLVKFNSIKTQFQIISLSTFSQNFNINFNDSTITNSNNLNILGLNINSKLSWKPHINQLAKAASQKLGILYRCRPFFTCEQLLRIYKGLIRPCLEYCSHVWGGSSSTHLLDRVESKAYRLINSPTVTANIPSLSLRRNVVSLSLFYRYYFVRCSVELASRVPPTKLWHRGTRQASLSHAFCVDVGHRRIGRYDVSFFPSTSRLWNNLPPSVFPPSYNLSIFKKRVYTHLIDSQLVY